MAQALPSGNSAEGVLALLGEDDDALKVYALQQINATVHQFWHQASGSVATIEALFEDEDFSHPELAALVASKIFYYLGDLKEAQGYALGAGELFEADSATDYGRTVLDACLDSYIAARREAWGAGGAWNEDSATADPPGLDPRLRAIVQRRLDACLAAGQAEQAVGFALESRRLDLLGAAVAASRHPAALLAHALDVTTRTVVERGFRARALRALADLSAGAPQRDAPALARGLTALEDADAVADLVHALLEEGGEQELLAFHIGFDLVDAQLQGFTARVASRLKQLAAPAVEAASEAAAEIAAAAAPEAEGEAAPLLPASTPAPAAQPVPAAQPALPQPLASFLAIASGSVSVELERQFLARSCRADVQILKNIKAGVEARNGVCHSATVWANALMHAGTGVDAFLRSNLDWLAKATNWAKFGATAGLGVIQRGNVGQGRSRTLMSPYLPQAPGGATGSPYSEGGALYALGLIHANHGEGARQLLLESLRATQQEVIQHGACLGLGIAGLGSEDAEVFEDVKNVLYTDNAVSGEAAGYGLGLLYAGSGSDERGAEMLAYAHDTQHEKIVRALGIGIAFVHYGREEAADGVIEAMTRDQNATIRYGGQFALGMAYRGTRNNGAIAKLLHFAVTDVSYDVRRAAAMNLGFVLLSAPDQCPRLVALLAGSYNPHVRYGSAMAVGIACAGTGSKEAVALLEPMLNDATDFVQQGALIALAMVLVEQPAARTETLRARIDKLHGNKGVEIMVRMGAIMAAGILDAGGRNATIGLQSRTGPYRRTAVVGLALFLQYWYWHPLAYTLSLALHPTAILGVDATLRAPADFKVTTRCKASAFAYPPPVVVEDKRSRDKVPTAVLSTTVRSMARAAAKKEETGKEAPATEADAMEVEGGAKGSAEDGTAGGETGAAASAPQEPSSFVSDNPARVVPSQRRYVTFDRDQRWQPVKTATTGFVVLRDTQPSAGPPEYLFQEASATPGPATAAPPAAAPSAAAPAADEPPPPAPFEYIPS